MGIINVLDAQVANLIAAGEVVERPSSAVKELLENAIDAGATRITVEIKNGGVSLMRITDNGCGMTKEDAMVCIKRHATSKIKNASDLDGIATLGFRGEALAAISSVSNMRIMTRTKDSVIGVVLECRAGEIISVEEAGCPEGTTILVEELFANVPARRKFLKRDASETASVAAVVEKIALSRPDVAIKFITDGAPRFATAGDGNLMNVIYAVLGRDFAKKMVKVHDMTEGIEVEGFIGTPENCRGNRNYENFFINGRYVKCQTASAAVEQAFSSYIPSDRFPCCVISLNINPAFVDVNVHPQKMEVKFSNDKPVFNAVYCAVRNTLMNRISRPTIGASEPVRMTGDSYRLYSDIIGMKTDTAEEASKIADDRDLLNVKYEQLTVQSEAREKVPVYEPPAGYEPTEKTPDGKPPLSPSPEKQKMPEVTRTAPPPPMPEEKNQENSWEKPLPPVSAGCEISGEAAEQEEPMPDFPGEETVPCPWFRVAGVVFNCYVFVELENKMLIVDKHAAHERILFEQMRENRKSGDPASQLLMLPLEIKLTNEEYAAALEYQTEFRQVGFDFTEGEQSGSMAILQHPSALNAEQAADMFTELAARLSDGTGDVLTSRDRIYEKALYQASCKAAVKGGREDSPENIHWIVEQVLSRPRIKYCPHGRPVAFEMTKSQFERQFERT